MGVDSLGEHSRRLRAREFVQESRATLRRHALPIVLSALIGVLLGVATNGVPF